MNNQTLLLTTNLTAREAELLDFLLAARDVAGTPNTIAKHFVEGFIVDEYEIYLDQHNEWVVSIGDVDECGEFVESDQPDAAEIFSSKSAATAAIRLFLEIDRKRLEAGVYARLDDRYHQQIAFA